MYVGLSSYSLPWTIGSSTGRIHSHRDLLALAVDLEVGVVQFADNLPLDDLSQRELRDLASFAEKRNVRIEVGTRGIGRLQQSLDAARAVGAGFVRLVIDDSPDEPSPAAALRRISVFESAFRAANCMLAIENHDRQSVSELVGLIDGLGDWTGICFDTANSLGSLEGPVQVALELAPFMINAHVKDVLPRRLPHGLGFVIEGTPLGEGAIDLPSLIPMIEFSGRVESAILELWTPPQANLDETVALEMEWVERSLRYLGTLPSFTFAA